MFVRVKESTSDPNKKYVQIVQSSRVGDKVSQKIVRHVGVSRDKEELKKLLSLGEFIKRKLENNSQIPLFSPEHLSQTNEKLLNKKIEKINDQKENDYKVNLKNLIEEQRIVNGIHDIYGLLFDELGYQNVFPNPARHKSTVKTFKNIVLSRIANPKSKRASIDMLEEDFGITIPLDGVYRMMDKLDDKAVKKLNDLTYQNTAGLFQEKIDVIFFDCTTIYFESFAEDEFKRNGYSKDLKFNQPQTLLALMVTKYGLPIGYQDFPGDTYEEHTVIPIINKIRKDYDIDKVIFVADAGMFSDDNLKEIEKFEKNKIEYVVGSRLKNTPKELKEKILDRNNYRKIDENYQIGRFDYKERKLIISYSENRARKDSYDRMKAIERIRKKISKQKNLKEYLSNYGSKKYLKITGESAIELDLEKIREDSKWDGLHGVITNAEKLSDEEIIEQYHNLWNVENAFRLTKHDLKVRPVFHWKPERIKAHLAISFASYALVKYLEYRVCAQYICLSPEKIRQELIRVQTSILYEKKKKIRYALPSKMSIDAKKIYKLCGMNRSLTPYIVKKL